MILQKAPLAVAVAAALTLSVQAKADLEYTGPHTSINVVVDSDLPHGIVIDDATVGSLDVDIQQSEVADSVIIANSRIDSAYIENNAGEIGSLIDMDNPGGNDGVLIVNSTLAGVDAVDMDEKVLLVNTGSIEAEHNIIDHPDYGEYLGIAVRIKDSQVTGSLVNENHGAQGGSIEGFVGVRIDGGTFNGNLHNEDDVNISQARIDEVLAIEASTPTPPAGYDAELDPISLIRGEVAGVDIRNGEVNGSIRNSGHIEGGENAIKLTRNATMNGDIVNSGTIKSTIYSAIYLRDSELNGSIVNLAESGDNGAGEITSEGDHGIFAQRSDINGNIVNAGSISASGAGIAVDGSLYDEEYSDEGNGSYNFTERETTAGTRLTGNIVNRGSISADEGIVVVATDMEGNIVNEGQINGGNGIYVESGYERQYSDSYDADTGIRSAQDSDKTVTTTLTGDIINATQGHIEAFGTGIVVEGINLQGDIDNAGTISAQGGKGIEVVGGYSSTGTWGNTGASHSWESKNAHIQGSINNSGHIDSRSDGIYLEGVTLEGDINNSGDITTLSADGIAVYGGDKGTHTASFSADGHASKTSETPVFSRINGNINNSGNIETGASGIFLSGSDVTGDINNSGAITANEDGIALRGGYAYAAQDSSSTGLEETETAVAAHFTGNINNRGTIAAAETGIDIRNNSVNGAINNTGSIEAGEYGIRIDDSVTGNLVINQSAGAINAATAIRLNSATRVNYTGGAINGDVNNQGGTFYVEGNRIIAGDYAQSAGATLALGLHAESSLTANNITLTDGSRVLIDLSSGSLYLGSGEHQVELLKANGELTASDISVETTSSLVEVASWTLNADGNLELVIDNTSLTEVANLVAESGSQSGQQARNSAALAAAIDALGQGTPDPATAQFLNELIELFQNDDPTALAGVLNQLLPDVTGSAVGSALSASNMSNGQVSVRARGLASGDTFTKTGIWIQALAADAEQDERDGIAGYDADTHGFVLGLDGELNNGAVIGAAYSFTNTDSDSATSSSDTDYHMLTGYWGQSYGKVLLDGQVYYAWGDNSSRRAIGATADYDSKLYGARIGTGYQLDLGNDAQLIPTLSLDYSRLSVDGYTEKGAGALNIQGEDYNRLELGLAGELNKTYQINQMLVTPRLTLGVYHDFEAEAQSVTAAFAAAPAATFTVTGAEPEKTRYTAGFGVEMLKGENFSADVEYNYNWQDDFDAHAGALKLRWEF